MFLLRGAQVPVAWIQYITMVFSIQRCTISVNVQPTDPTTRDTTKDIQSIHTRIYIVIANQSSASSKVAMAPRAPVSIHVRRVMWLLSCEKLDDVWRDDVTGAR